MTRNHSCHLLDMLAEVSDARKKGLASFEGNARLSWSSGCFVVKAIPDSDVAPKAANTRKRL